MESPLFAYKYPLGQNDSNMDVQRNGILHRRRHHMLLEGFKLLGTHKEHTLAAFFLVSEIITFVLTSVGNNKWDFLLGAFVVSLLVLVTALVSHIKGRTTMATRQLAETIVMVIEIGVSLIQSIATFIYFVLAVLHIKPRFNESVVPVFLAIYFLIFTFCYKDEEEEHPIPSLEDPCNAELPLVNYMANNSTETTIVDGMGEMLSHSSMGGTPAPHMSPINSEIHYANRLQNIEVSDSSSCEYHILSLGDPHIEELPLFNSVSNNLISTTSIYAIDGTPSHSSMAAGSASHVSPTDYEINYADPLQNIEVNVSGTGERDIDSIICTCGNYCGRGSKFGESSVDLEANV